MVGLIVGEGNLPRFVIFNLRKQKKEFLILDLTKNKKYKKYKNSYPFDITQLAKAISFLKNKNCKKILLIGKVIRPNLSKALFNPKLLLYLPRLLKVFKKGDSNLLSEIIKIFKENNITVLSSMHYSPELILTKSLSTKSSNKDKEVSINEKKGLKILKNLSQFDVGQTIILNNGYVVAIEGPEGTNETIKRAGNIAIKYNFKNKSIMIKVPKQKQDLRVDMPVIGLQTIRLCINNNIGGIIVKKNQTIILEKNKIVKLINKNNFLLKTI